MSAPSSACCEGASGPHRVRFAPGRGAPLAYFSPTGKVGKSVLKGARAPLRIPAVWKDVKGSFP